MPMNQSILASVKADTSSERAFSKSGNCDITSTKPITAKRSKGNKDCSPCAFILGPPTPIHTTSSIRSFTCAMKSAPRESPDASPATIPMTNGLLGFRDLLMSSELPEALANIVNSTLISKD